MILSLFAAFAADSWPETIDRVLDSCVVIKMDRTRPFDGNAQSSSEASGFVVDAERGLVMTNRHVVTTGPTLARAIFNNQEEVDLVPVYVDPVHDFGLFRYDPKELEFIEPISLQLSPDVAQVGTEIRVIGNDAAEQLSILAGTLSRLDRAAPYWDQNTFYLQAASSTSGGSSGSPVFDQAGRVVALNAGARNDAATSLFLPLKRVAVALQAVQDGRIPSRGTTQVIFEYQAWDELRRLGLPRDLEAKRRAAWGGTGLLVVGRVNDGGPGDGVLEPGDILLAVQGEPVFEFVALERALDGAVGTSVRVEVLRGGAMVSGLLPVQDLHGLTPSAYLEIGEGLLHPVGYLQATRAGRPMAGVEVARAGRLLASAGIPKRAVITAIGGRSIHDLHDAVAVLGSIPDGARVPIRHAPMNAPEDERVTTMRMFRGVWPVRRCERAALGAWPCEDLPAPPAAPAPEPIALTWIKAGFKKKLQPAANSLVTVQFRPQLNLDSAQGDSRKSAGVLLDATGLVLTDRYAIPVHSGEARVRLQDAPSVPAKILYQDPVHNVALLRIDMQQVQLPAGWVFPELSTGLDLDAVSLVAIERTKQIYHQKLNKARPKPLALRDPRYPKFVEHNTEVIGHDKLERPSIGGVLVDKRGRIVGLERAYAYDEGTRLKRTIYGVDLRDSLLALRRWRAGATHIRDLGLVLQAVPLADAREAGFPSLHADRIRALRPDDPRVLRVRRISGDSPAANVLKASDWVVAVQGEPVASFAALEDQVLEAVGAVELTLIRDLQELVVSLEPMLLPVSGTRRAVLWSGVLVQEEPPAVALYWQSPSAGVYLSWYYGGSPAHRYQTSYARRLLEIDGQPISSLDAFIEATTGRPDRSTVRLKLQGKNGKEWVSTLVLDQTWWPTELFERTDRGWVRAVIRFTPPGSRSSRPASLRP